MLESVENAMTETPRVRVSCAVEGTESANSGPRMISAPSASACWVPWLAPCGLPPSSLIRSWTFGFWNSASAISAAFFIDCAATPALPAADRERLLWRAGGTCLWLRRTERAGKLAKTLLHAGAGAKQRRAENEADR